MNSNTAPMQTGHHHHQTSSSNSANHPSTIITQAAQQIKPAVNPNPSVHRFNSLNENPWLLQSEGITPPLRQHKRRAPTPPAVAAASASLGLKSNNQHLSVVRTCNPPVHFTAATQTQTAGIAPASVSPKSPNQSFLHQTGAGSIMSTSLNSANAGNMAKNQHHLPAQSHQPLSTSLHQSTSSSNNNNNNKFDDLNKTGPSSISGASSSQQKKVEMKLNTMP